MTYYLWHITGYGYHAISLVVVRCLLCYHNPHNPCNINAFLVFNLYFTPISFAVPPSAPQ